MAFYRICPDCGAYLDPGEQCSCHEEHLIEMERKEKATESTTVTTDGDTCGFDIEVIDLDSAEHIYLNYYFQFSTIVAASGE